MSKSEDLSFEAALAELEQIIKKLETGDVELEESIVLYERGAELKKHCETTLKSAREKIEKVVLGADGVPETQQADFQ